MSLLGQPQEVGQQHLVGASHRPPADVAVEETLKAMRTESIIMTTSTAEQQSSTRLALRRSILMRGATLRSQRQTTRGEAMVASTTTILLATTTAALVDNTMSRRIEISMASSDLCPFRKN